MITSSPYVYSSMCSWHGEIEKTKRTGPGIPCCPHCRSVLFQVDSPKIWWDGAEAHDKTHPHYLEFLKWTTAQERCWPTLRDAADAFEAATGKKVQF